MIFTYAFYNNVEIQSDLLVYDYSNCAIFVNPDFIGVDVSSFLHLDLINLFSFVWVIRMDCLFVIYFNSSWFAVFVHCELAMFCLSVVGKTERHFVMLFQWEKNIASHCVYATSECLDIKKGLTALTYTHILSSNHLVGWSAE